MDFYKTIVSVNIVDSKFDRRRLDCFEEIEFSFEFLWIIMNLFRESSKPFTSISCVAMMLDEFIEILCARIRNFDQNKPLSH